MVEQKTKKKKEKPSYTTWQNIVFTVSNMWEWDKLLVILCIAKAPLNIVLNLAWLFIIRLVLLLIENGSGIEAFII